jgi:diguanylate cyclase (GGDEF)-like protein
LQREVTVITRFDYGYFLVNDLERGRFDFQFNFSSCSVVGELPSSGAQVLPDSLIRSVIERLDREPDLPGVIVQDQRIVRLLSRERLHQWLSKPFGTDLFLNRPVSYLLRTSFLAGLVVPADTRVEDAVRLALQRPGAEIHEPLVVVFPTGEQRVLDFHVLLLAQTQLLTQANRFINQQVETGRALLQLMDLNEVFEQILDYLSSFISFDQGMILVVDRDMQEYVRPSQLIGFPGQCVSHDLAYDSKAFAHINGNLEPLLLTDIPHASEWCDPRGFSSLHSWIGYPLVYNNRLICLLSLSRLIQNTDGSNATKGLAESFTRSDLDLIAGLSATFTAAVRNAHLHAELRALAVTDPMTGTYNRRGFFDTAQNYFEQQNAGSNPFCSILVLDIDFFKRINDTYGHHIGDVVIRSVAQECRRVLREFDLLGRYGGEEFIALLPGTDQQGALVVAERLRNHIARMAIQTGRGADSVTVSIGISTTPPGEISLEELLRRADEALFRAKGLGRNRYEVWENSNPDRNVELQGILPRGRTGPLGLSIRQPVIRSLDSVETESILGWVRVLELRGKEQEKHAAEVAEITVRLCRKVGFPESDLIHVFRGSLLHDVGKLALSDSVLNKPGALSPEEWEEMRRHVTYGIEIISTISYLRPALAIPSCHHEKWDGSGYPRGLMGNQIPLEARIFSLADVWSALRSDRCYRPAWPMERIIDHFRAQKGVHFDPDLVDLFLEMIART